MFDLREYFKDIESFTALTPALKDAIMRISYDSFNSGKREGRSEGWNDSLVWSGNVGMIIDEDYLAWLKTL